MKLGQLIALLKALPQDGKCIITAPVCLFPGPPMSYRGYYDQLALDVKEGYHIDAPKLADVVTWLEDAVGKTFEGYKGGDFTMHGGTPVWLSRYGKVSRALITGARSDDYDVTRITYELVEV